MQVVIATRPGPPEVLVPVERPDPEPGPGQVVVAVEVAATTFIDTQVRAGAGPRPLDPAAFPVVLGNGVGGTVLSTGEGVDERWTGARVVTTTGGSGGYAERALASADDLHALPEGLDVQQGVAVLADGRTALALARAARITEGEWTAVTAAAGGVGSLLVQLVQHAGSHVVALAGDGRKLAHARALGAAHAANYREPAWKAELDELPLAVAFDGVGGDVSTPLAAALRPGGRYVAHGAASGTWGSVDTDALAARDITVIPLTAVGSDAAELHALVDEALQLTADGRLRPTIGLVVPLARAADAHAAMEARSVIGKTLLVPGG